ncbi:MAG TPA: hypothetical protein ENI05_13480 [Porticoccus sp.]|nr:hypothetical protein [Porticoccus sp.]
MAADIYPDTDELFLRLAVIQEAAVPDSAQTKTPMASVSNYPYWIMMIEDLNLVPEVPGDGQWKFQIGMGLVRSTSERASSDLGIMKRINNDMVAVMKEFGRRLSLQSTEYPDPPDGMVRNSVRIRCLGYREMGAAQEFGGSGYALSISYNVYVANSQLRF